MCDAPLGVVVEYGLFDEFEELVSDWVFSTRFAAAHLAQTLNHLEDERS